MEKTPHVWAKVDTAKRRRCQVLRHNGAFIDDCRQSLTKMCHVWRKDDQCGICFETGFYVVDVDLIQLFPCQTVNHDLSINKALLWAKESGLLFVCIVKCSQLPFLLLQIAGPHQGTKENVVTFSDFVTKKSEFEGYKNVKMAEQIPNFYTIAAREHALLQILRANACGLITKTNCVVELARYVQNLKVIPLRISASKSVKKMSIHKSSN